MLGIRGYLARREIAMEQERQDIEAAKELRAQRRARDHRSRTVRTAPRIELTREEQLYFADHVPASAGRPRIKTGS